MVSETALRFAAQLEAHADYYWFVKRIFEARRGYDWLHNWHHEEMCRHLQRVVDGDCKRLIINCPPRYSKTDLAVVNFIPWALGKFPDAEFIHTSYSGTLALQNAAAARDIVQMDEYLYLFPHVQLRTDSAAKGDWRTTAGGVVYATGAGGTITGFGAGKMREGFGGAIIIDDPHKADEVRSDTMRKNVIDGFKNTLESRKNSPDTPIILIMQRLHESDLAGFLLSGGNGEQWEHVSFPAIQPDGKALWPAKHNIDTLRVMQRSSPYVFAGQYQQEPAPPQGGEFKPDTMQIVDAVPAGTRMVRGWDLAGTDADGDYTAGALLGQMPDGRYIIAGMKRDQLGPEGVEALIKATATEDSKGVTICIPQDPGQAGKAQVRALTRMLSGYTTTSKPVSGDKVQRARPFAAQVNVGNVVMLRGDWNEALKTEMRLFPNGNHDDQIDGLSTAFDELTGTNFSLLDFYGQQAAEQKALREGAENSAPPVVANLYG